MQAKDPSTNATERPGKPETPKKIAPVSPTGIGVDVKQATMMEVIGWELTQALYHAHRLCVLPPTAKQVKNKNWPEGQHRKFLIETAKLLTSLLVIVGEEAQQKAKELMNEQSKSNRQANNIRPNETAGVAPRDTASTEGNSDINKGPASKIIIPEAFGH